MAGQIRVTPEELRSAASFLDGKREEINGAVNALNSKINEMASNWEGASQSSFIAQFNEKVLPVLQKDFPEIMTGISSQINSAANTLEQADLDIAKAFK